MHWLQINTYKQYLFLWGRILSFVCVFHVLSGIVIFWCYRSHCFYFKSAVHAHEQIPIVFMPQMVPLKQTQTKPESHQKTVPVQKKKSSAKDAVQEKKKVVEPEVKKAPTKTDTIKKNENKFVDAPQKKEAKKSDNKKTEDSVKNKEAAIQNKAAADEKQDLMTQNKKEKDDLLIEVDQRAALFMNMQKQIIAEWSAPVGMPSGTACTISFFVDLNGVLGQITVDKSSGILIYDISARTAILKTVMPRWSRGKSFTITFHA